MHNEKYIKHLSDFKKHHFGYPYNLDFDFSNSAELLSFFINNLGDPFVQSNYKSDSRQYEHGLISYFRKLWCFDEAWGYITSSGTEGNLAAILYAKISLGSDIAIYYSRDTHYSVPKAALAYGIRAVEIDSDMSGEINYQDLLLKMSLSSESKAIIISNISTTFKGAFDSPKNIIDTAELAGYNRSDIYVHGDGALGGMILPFIPNVELNKKIKGSSYYDSISVSGHKMPGCPIPCGVILVKQLHIDRFSKDIEYLGSKDTTLNGSRSGLAACLLHQSINRLSFEGWENTIDKCLELTLRFKEILLENGISADSNIYSNIVVFPKPNNILIDRWQLSCVGDLAHVVIMPNHDSDSINLISTDIVDNFNF